MDCQEARTKLLQADDPRPGRCGSAPLAAHLRTCTACRRLAAKLIRLEEAWQALPVPARAQQAREAFLSRLPAQRVARRLAAVPARWHFAPPRWAIAASVAAAVAVVVLGTWLLASKPPTIILREGQATSKIVDRLLGWNLALTQLDSPAERAQLYNAQAPTLKATLQEAALLADDRDLAETLLANASWLAEHDDPVAEADRFNDVADKLLAQMRTATDANDFQRVARLTDLYGQVAEHGIAANLKRAEIVGPMPQEHEEKLQQVADRQDGQSQTLEKLAEHAPPNSRVQKEVRQAHAVAKKNNKPKRRPKDHRPPHK
jgi:hypothetical protein